MAIIAWIVFGLVVGLIARFLMPGAQSMGLIMTTVLGIAGSFVGGYVASLLSGGELSMSSPAGWIGAVLGSILLLFLYGMLAKKSA